MTVPADLKDWYALSCPRTGIRFDARTLELLDADADGRIRSDELLAALAFLKDRGVSPTDLATPDAETPGKLDEILKKIAAIDSLPPTEADKAALAAWEVAGRASDVAVCGEETAAAEAALAAVEPTVDAYFTPPDDMPLVTDEPDRTLPLASHLNPKYLEAIREFATVAVTPILGEKSELTRLEWKRMKAAFAPYRAWLAAKPAPAAPERAALVEEERFLRYRLNLGEFLANYVTMDRLYDGLSPAIFQTGVLRIDGKELSLCFHVESEAAHSALVSKSKCCVVYAKLTRPAEKAERQVCAVVTAGTVAGLYVGRNGVFYDRDGRDWEATVTKVVEAQVSLAEAFWSPWRKLGETVAATAKKFLGEKQAAGAQTLTASVSAPRDGVQSGGAAMASSVAAIGIGLGMLGAAAASVMAAVSTMGPFQLVGALVALVLVVSLPSVILTWFNLRKRDLGAILNASGWAINRPMRFSMARARSFTKCARPVWPCVWLLLALVLSLVLAAVSIYLQKGN